MLQLLGPFTEESLLQTVRRKLREVPAEHPWYRTGWLGPLPSAQRLAAYQAQDDPQAWLATAQGFLQDDNPVEAAVALAAARWLDPAAGAEMPPIELPGLSQRDLDHAQPGQPFHKRHGAIWSLKKHTRNPFAYTPTHLRLAGETNHALAYTPTLLRLAGEENFALRSRSYRSLAQNAHPAVLQCLHEGTADPHPFARAQAVRGLGWLGDPTFVTRLLALVEGDPNADVRRTAVKALSRIAAFWLFYGEWTEIRTSPARLRRAAKQLLEAGLPLVAFEIAPDDVEALLGEQESDRLYNSLEQQGLGFNVSVHPGEFFPAGQAFEHLMGWAGDEPVKQRTVSLFRVKGWLESVYPELQMQGLFYLTRHGLAELLPQVEQLLGAPEPDVVWNARRALRQQGHGTMEQRRAFPSTWKSGYHA